jgi:excisionase family DNA binding protein
MNTAHDYLTRQQAADQLQVTPATVDSYIKKGLLKATKVGSKAKRSPVRISATSVEKLLEGIR